MPKPEDADQFFALIQQFDLEHTPKMEDQEVNNQVSQALVAILLRGTTHQSVMVHVPHRPWYKAYGHHGGPFDADMRLTVDPAGRAFAVTSGQQPEIVPIRR
ncbi:MAG TPA: hypothetical protein VKT78_20065 [Fimbriimonadaceae bacterium]|nr:hypothetical protein [Fimbriimonadaceae bacterium]